MNLIEAYLNGMGSEGKVITLIIMCVVGLILIGMVLQGLRDFVLALFHGYPAKTVQPTRPTPKCEHEDNLQKLCLRGPSGCATKSDCASAVEDGDY